MFSVTFLPEQLDVAWRLAIAYALMALLFALNLVSVSYPFTGAVKIFFFWMGLYYWSLYRPAVLPVWVVFAAGLVMDALGGTPFGLTAFIFVCARWFVVDQRRFMLAHSFWMVWLGFGLLILAAGILEWFLYGLINFSWSGIRGLLFSSALSIMLFPAVSLLLHVSHRILPIQGPVFTLKGGV